MQCRVCKEDIKKEATGCPYCGEKDQTGCFAVMGVIVVIIFLGMLPFLLLGSIL